MALTLGMGAPDDSIGSSGDYYLRLDPGARFYYGPKTTTWSGVPVNSLSGPSGPAILGGMGAPSPSTGGVGQLYADTQSGDLWGPKTTAGWGSAASGLFRGNRTFVGTGPFVAANFPLARAGDRYIDNTLGAVAEYYLS